MFEKQLHAHPDVSVSMSNRAESFNSPCLEVHPFTLFLLSLPVNTVLETDGPAFAHRRCVNHGWTSVSKASLVGSSVHLAMTLYVQLTSLRVIVFSL